MILHRLARLAMANELANLRRNLARLAPDGDPDVEARVAGARAVTSRTRSIPRCAGYSSSRSGLDATRSR